MVSAFTHLSVMCIDTRLQVSSECAVYVCVCECVVPTRCHSINMRGAIRPISPHLTLQPILSVIQCAKSCNKYRYYRWDLPRESAIREKYNDTGPRSTHSLAYQLHGVCAIYLVGQGLMVARVSYRVPGYVTYTTSQPPVLCSLDAVVNTQEKDEDQLC